MGWARGGEERPPRLPSLPLLPPPLPASLIAPEGRSAVCLRGEEGERAAATELSAMDGARTMAPTAGRFPSCDGKRDLRMTLEGLAGGACSCWRLDSSKSLKYYKVACTYARFFLLAKRGDLGCFGWRIKACRLHGMFHGIRIPPLRSSSRSPMLLVWSVAVLCCFCCVVFVLCCFCGQRYLAPNLRKRRSAATSFSEVGPAQRRPARAASCPQDAPAAAAESISHPTISLLFTICIMTSSHSAILSLPCMNVTVKTIIIVEVVSVETGQHLI